MDFKNLYAVESYRSHQKLIDMPGPSIIIAGSGMLTGGRMVAHLEKALDDPRNNLVFVGYQAKGTPGRKILEHAKRKDGQVRFNNHPVSIKAGIDVLSGFSAHADQAGLVGFVESIPSKPGAIKLVHGENDAREALKSVLQDKGYNVL